MTRRAEPGHFTWMSAAKQRRPSERKGPHEDLRGLPGRLRVAIGDTDQKAVAAASGVPASSISRILLGRSLVGVYADTVLRLARTLGVSAGWLLCGEGLQRGVWVQIESGRADATALVIQKLTEVSKPVLDEGGAPGKESGKHKP